MLSLKFQHNKMNYVGHNIKDSQCVNAPFEYKAQCIGNNTAYPSRQHWICIGKVRCQPIILFSVSFLTTYILAGSIARSRR